MQLTARKRLAGALLGGFMFCLCSTSVFSQELWTGVEGKLSPIKNVSLRLGQQIRFSNQVEEYKSAVSDVAVRYKLGSLVSLQSTFRYSRKANTEADRGRLVDARQRYTGDLLLAHSFNTLPWKVQYRLRYQLTNSNHSNKSYHYLRNKVAFQYLLSKRLTPYILGEAYYRFDGKNELRVLRFTAGWSARILKNLDLGLFYRVEQEVNVNYPEKTHIIGVMAEFDLGRLYVRDKTTAFMPFLPGFND